MSESRIPSPLRVMLIDDHPVVRAGYRRLLELEADLEVVAEHGDVDAALQDIDGDWPAPPQVIVVDLAMAHRSGLELVREVRQRHPEIRVLVFSMHDNAAVVAEALRLGAAGFVTKGSAPEELVHCVRRVVVERGAVLSRDLVNRRVMQEHRDEEPLTLRELEILRLLASGESLQAIGDRLHLSSKTVSNYQTMLKHKLRAATAIELLRHARERGYVA